MFINREVTMRELIGIIHTIIMARPRGLEPLASASGGRKMPSFLQPLATANDQ